jgi:hypothetical protein
MAQTADELAKKIPSSLLQNLITQLEECEKKRCVVDGSWKSFTTLPKKPGLEKDDGDQYWDWCKGIEKLARSKIPAAHWIRQNASSAPTVTASFASAIRGLRAGIRQPVGGTVEPH